MLTWRPKLQMICRKASGFIPIHASENQFGLGIEKKTGVNESCGVSVGDGLFRG
jgi:hypothetical protein